MEPYRVFKPQKAELLTQIEAENVAIRIAAIDNMLDMIRGHQTLERRDARDHELAQLMDKLSQNTYGSRIEMPAEDTHRTIEFGEPKKNPP